MVGAAEMTEHAEVPVRYPSFDEQGTNARCCMCGERLLVGQDVVMHGSVVSATVVLGLPYSVRFGVSQVAHSLCVRREMKQ